MFSTSSRQYVGVCAMVAAVSALGLVVRLHGIADKGIWLDEGWSWWAAKLSIGDMVEWTGTDKHPPLYYAVLHYWIVAFGDSESMLRAPSVIAGALTITLLMVAVVLAKEYLIAALSGVLLALHPMHVTYSQEARMYPLLGLLAVASSAAAALLARRPTLLRAITFAALASAMAYTHYSAFFVIALQAALLGTYALRPIDGVDGRRLAVFSTGALLIIGLAFLWWVPNVWRELGDGDALPALTGDAVELLAAQLFGLDRIGRFWIAIAVPITVLGISGVVRRRRSPEVVFVTALAAVPVIEILFSLSFTTVAAPRQASPFAAGFAVLAAIAVVECTAVLRELQIPRTLASAMTGVGALALAVIMVAGLARWYDAPSREDWRSAAAHAPANGGIVFVWRGYAYVPLAYYLRTGQAAPFEGVASVDAASSRLPGSLLFSHYAQSEMQQILGDLADGYEVGAPSRYGNQIVAYPISRRLSAASE